MKELLFIYIIQYFLLMVRSENCITEVILYAQTSDVDSAGADNGKCYLKYHFQPSPGTITYHLYDRPGNDMDRNKGTYWPFDRPASCVTIDDFKSMTLESSGSDTWTVHSLMTYVVLDDNRDNLFLQTHDFSINAPVGGNFIPPDDKITLHDNTVIRDNAAIANKCVTRVAITVLTGDESGASSDYLNAFHFKLYGEWSSKVMFYDHAHADDMSKYRGDMWTYNIEDIYPDESCVKFGSIEGFQLEAQSIDSWEVEHVFVTAEVPGGWALLVGELNVHAWLDTNEHNKGHVSYAEVKMRNT